jgi:hypothetical protein
VRLRCLYCKTKFHNDVVQKSEYNVPAPFAATITLWSTSCPQCGRVNLHSRNGSSPSDSKHEWLLESENMTRFGAEDVDDLGYRYITPEFPPLVSGSRRSFRPAIDGPIPGNYTFGIARDLVVFWAWSPVWTVEQIVQHTAFRSDPDFLRTDRDRLLVMSQRDLPSRPDDFVRLTRKFTSIALVHESFLGGAAGPYPSLRFERSMRSTWAARRLIKIKHYWPSASLPSADFIPLATNAQMVAAWTAKAASLIS